MNEPLDHGLRPNLRPWLIAAAVNVLLAGVLVGIPYTRGPERARDVLPRFIAFAACFYAAEPAEPPGLGLPRGDRARYATLALDGPADWPARCRPALRAIPAEESMFLFPGVKSAEAQLRASVSLLDQELARLQVRRRAGESAVSDRPMRAMGHLRAALAELGISSGLEELRAGRDAIVLGDSIDLPAPSIIPIRISTGGPHPLGLAVVDGALLASAMDSRSVGHVAVVHDGVAPRITRRPRLATGLLGGREPPWVIWSTSAEPCASDPAACAARATGLAALLEDRQTLEPMFWLGGHPHGPPTQAIQVFEREAWMVAMRPPGIEVRRFALPEPTVRALGAERDVPQLAAIESWPLDVEPSAIAWLPVTPGGGPATLVVGAAGSLARLALAPGAVPEVFDAPAGRLRLATCGRASDGWVAAGTERGVAMLHGSGMRETTLRVRPPDEGHLAVVCAGEGAHVLAVDGERLFAARCAAEGCAQPVVLAEDVASFDAVTHGGALVVAWTRDAQAGAISITRVEGARVETMVPSPCWTDPQDGPCGAPRLATDGRTLMLIARDESDLRVLTSPDARTWAALQGLEQE